MSGAKRAGMARKSVIGGIRRRSPVRGGERGRSRASRPMAADMLPPAEVPPTTKPTEGLAEREEALDAA